MTLPWLYLSVGLVERVTGWKSRRKNPSQTASTSSSAWDWVKLRLHNIEMPGRKLGLFYYGEAPRYTAARSKFSVKGYEFRIEGCFELLITNLKLHFTKLK